MIVEALDDSILPIFVEVVFVAKPIDCTGGWIYLQKLNFY